VLRGSPLLPVAFTLEAQSNAVAFLVGPALAVIAATSLWPAAGTRLAASMIVGFGAIFAMQRRTAPHARSCGPGNVGRQARLRSRRFGVILLVNLALGGFFGSMQLSVSAFAAAHHAAGSAGLLYSILSCASLLSGVLFARRRWHPPAPVQLSVALGFMAAGCLPLLTANSLVWLGAFLLLPGLASSNMATVSPRPVMPCRRQRQQASTRRPGRRPGTRRPATATSAAAGRAAVPAGPVAVVLAQQLRGRRRLSAARITSPRSEAARQRVAACRSVPEHW
jgi:hypothetical protein